MHEVHCIFSVYYICCNLREMLRWLRQRLRAVRGLLLLWVGVLSGCPWQAVGRACRQVRVASLGRSTQVNQHKLVSNKECT